jgi:hypothetical protein
MAKRLARTSTHRRHSFEKNCLWWLLAGVLGTPHGYGTHSSPPMTLGNMRKKDLHQRMANETCCDQRVGPEPLGPLWFGAVADFQHRHQKLISP